MGLATEAKGMGGRETGIDLGRLIAMVAVICLHVRLDPVATDTGWYAIVNQLARFAVPFFFVAMGYFSKIGSGSGGALRAAGRLLALYALWSVLYLLAFGWPAELDWRMLLHGGNIDALWFLLSGALSLAFVWLVHRLVGVTGTVIVGLALYLVGLAAGYYSPLVFGVDLLPIWNVRDGLTFGVPFIAIGVWLASTKVRLSPLAAGALFAVAAVLQLAEIFALSQFGVFPLNHDFVASTLLFGPAAFLFFQSLNGMSWVQQPARLGSLALGIYVIHPALIRLLAPLGLPADPTGFWITILAVFVGSLAIAALLYRLPVLRYAVSTRPASRVPAAPEAAG
jgi:surface polysaccharide O-acyltransferase-like enzyme